MAKIIFQWMVFNDPDAGTLEPVHLQHGTVQKKLARRDHIDTLKMCSTCKDSHNN